MVKSKMRQSRTSNAAGDQVIMSQVVRPMRESSALRPYDPPEMDAPSEVDGGAEAEIIVHRDESGRFVTAIEVVCPCGGRTFVELHA